MKIDRALDFLASVYGPFGPEDAIPESAVDAAEARLGVRLPIALVALYRRTGRSEALHARHNTLVPLDRVDITADHLVFYEENQEVVVWAIARVALSEDDPPVVQGQEDVASGTWTFHPEFPSVSEFACAQGAWQAVQGGLPFVGVMESSPGAAALGVPSVATKGMTAWLVDGGVALVAGDDYLGLATRDEESFVAACGRLGVEVDDWDYATLTDE